MTSRAFNWFFYISLAVLAIIYGIGMTLDLMDIDTSTYAVISKQMFQSGNYLQLYLNGNDYLDKPPLVFWSACLSFKIFGIHDWAYRLPSVLVLALGIYSVYRYAKIFYSEQTAKLAALIMASSMAMYVMTSDVRIDTMLTGWVMFSLWQLAEYFKISNNEQGISNNEGKVIQQPVPNSFRDSPFKIQHLLLGGVGVGLAMLTKGPIGLIIPVMAFSVDFVYKRQWKNFIRWQYLLVIVVIAIILLPMCIGLYEQFDLHPEKIIYGRTGTSGLRFFFWTQSFGRITGESTWNNNPDPFFLYHSFLWSFAPWCIFFIPALYTEIKYKIKNSIQWSVVSSQSGEAITVAGFVVILIFLSRSKYQLPHYSFCIHPLAAIITAKYLNEKMYSETRSLLFTIFKGIHIFLLIVIFAILFLILFYVFPAPVNIYLPVIFSFLCFLYIWSAGWVNKFFPKILLITLLSYVTLTLILNLYFYPNVLTYQVGSQVSKDLNKTASDSSKLLIYKDYCPFSMEFYGNIPVAENIDGQTLMINLTKDRTYILADSADVKGIKKIAPKITIAGKYYNHSATKLSWDFLNPATRNSDVSKKVLLRY